MGVAISHCELSKHIDFVRIDGRRLMSYSIVLETAADGTKTAHNTQVLTALNEEGNRLLGSEPVVKRFPPMPL